MGFFDIFKKKEELDDVSQYMKERNQSSKFTQIHIQPNSPTQTFQNAPLTYGKKFELKVEDGFILTGKGAVVTGFVNGRIAVGDTAYIIHPDGSTLTTTITGIEQFRKQLDYAENANVGVFLRGISKNEVTEGDIIYA
jgi:translation elongation factor EF-Tu-like GTPase